MKKLWYAVMLEDEDTDWGTGTFNRRDAIRMAHEENDFLEGEGLDRTAYVAVIDGAYDEEGNPTTDPICIERLDEDGFMF